MPHAKAAVIVLGLAALLVLLEVVWRLIISPLLLG